MTISPNHIPMIDPIDEEGVFRTDNIKALEVVVETSHIVITNDTPLDPSIANTPLTSPGADAAAKAALVLPSELAGSVSHSADFGSVRPTVTALDHIRATFSSVEDCEDDDEDLYEWIPKGDSSGAHPTQGKKKSVTKPRPSSQGQDKPGQSSNSGSQGQTKAVPTKR